MSSARKSILRTVVLDKSAERAHDDAVEQHPEFEAAYKALEWLIARIPERGQQITVNGNEMFFYAQGSDRIRQTPVIGVLYTYTAAKVTVHHIAAWPFDHYGK